MSFSAQSLTDVYKRQKANDSTSVPELTALLHTVIENDEIRHCPHGRPIVIAFDKSELERRFGRIQ